MRALPSFPGGEVPAVGPLPRTAPAAPRPKPLGGRGCTSPVPAVSGELRPSTAERRSNNLPLPPPPPPFSFQRFYEILWLVAKSYPQGHSAAAGPSSWPAACAPSWPRAEQIAQGCSWWKIPPCPYRTSFAETPWRGSARAPPQTLVV